MTKCVKSGSATLNQKKSPDADNPVTNNLFAHIPDISDDEYFENILQTKSFSLEKIVSEGHATPHDTWLCQDRHEWVLLIKGEAQLQFKHNKAMYTLHPGDHLLIPAHTYHRVVWTQPGMKTFWLALHYDEE